MPHLIKSSVNVYILNKSKLLLGKRKGTGWMDGYLCPPGGHVEQGETPTIAMIREIKEELGIEVSSADLEFLCVAARNSSIYEYTAYEFILKDSPYEFTNMEPEKCSELTWVDIHNLPNNIIDDFRTIIQRSLIGSEHYLEIGY
jgi:ADP-ribose pyrophosphatase